MILLIFSDDEPEARYVEQTVAESNEMNNIIALNQQQLKSGHKQIVEQDRSIARSNVHRNNLVGVLRTNTYIEKGWAQKLKKKKKKM